MTCEWFITMVIGFVPDYWGCGTPSKWPLKMAYKWGAHPNYLRPSCPASPSSKDQRIQPSKGLPLAGPKSRE